MNPLGMSDWLRGQEQAATLPDQFDCLRAEGSTGLQNCLSFCQDRNQVDIKWMIEVLYRVLYVKMEYI